MTKLYVDIETSGLSPMNNYVTIIGVLTKDIFNQFILNVNLKQNIIDSYIKENDITEIIGYNHIAFDNKFLVFNEYVSQKNINELKQTDLMHQCHDLNLKGGLKAVEKILGIEREYEPLNFFQQKALWKKWINNNDWSALDRLLAYNREDVMNLPLVEEKLAAKMNKQNAAQDRFKKAYSKLS